MIDTLLLTSSVLIAGIFCVRKLTFGRITMKARYALWLLAAIRLLFPFSVGESALSVMNVWSGVLSQVRQTETDLYLESDVDPAGVAIKSSGLLGENNAASHSGGGKAEAGNGGQDAAAERLVPGQIPNMEKSVSAPRAGTGDNASKTEDVLGTKHVDFLRLTMSCVWLFGFLTVSGYMLLSRKRFVRYLKKNRIKLAPDALPKEYAERLSARAMRAYQVQGLPSPCLVERDIYIGSGVLSDPQSLPHILAHEYSHALHRDGWWAFLRCLLVALYWFDPFVWAAAYAARQDSELACDEEAVGLIGEAERFAYGRTLLHLLESGDHAETCPGMAFMLNRGENGVRERIGALAGRKRKQKAAAVLGFLAVLFLCGCAFTGAEEADKEGRQEKMAAVAGEAEQAVSEPERRMVNEGSNEEFERIRKEYEDVVAQGDAGDQAADEEAFEKALNYHGVMEGKDDGELALKREFDVQSYYEWKEDREGEKPQDGWYLLCEDQDAGISLYGLYTEEFGFRGFKTLIGEDVNTFDGRWCASWLTSNDNIRVLEQAEDGLPRRFVWKLPAEESGRTEIWRFYYANRYDTGTVDMKMLSEEDCLAWAKEYLSFTVDQEAAKVYVTYDGDMVLGAIDISAYRDFETEDAQIVSDAVCFTLDDPGADIYQAYSDAVWEKTALHLAVGLKFAGVEGLWFNGLPLLTVQIAEDGSSASGFRLDYPRIDESHVARVLWQEKKLQELREGIPDEQAAAQAAGSEERDGSEETGKNDLEKPLVNEGEGHHDLAIEFSNPCPDFERISDGYGERVHPVTGKVRTHTGVDLAAAEGADVLAAADGEVFMTGFDAVNGNYVVLWHRQSGQMTYYAHCKSVEVTKGQEVLQGEKIATVGQTGQATGPFLHFAISSANSWEEPYFLELE